MPELSPAEAKELIDGGAQLVDVRTAEEFAGGHLPGARHVPLDELDGSAASDLDRSRPVVIYCRSGDRSGMAADAFAASDWEARSIAGGIVAWAEEGLPVEGEVVERSGLPPR